MPWNEPTTESPEFARWVKSTCITESLWKKLSTMAFSLARKILNPEPAKRLKLPEILGHTWMKVEFTLNGTFLFFTTKCRAYYSSACFSLAISSFHDVFDS